MFDRSSNCFSSGAGGRQKRPEHTDNKPGSVDQNGQDPLPGFGGRPRPLGLYHAYSQKAGDEICEHGLCVGLADEKKLLMPTMG